MIDDMARMIRLEMTVEQHNELLRRSISYMEQQTAINERIANHIDDTKRMWDVLEEHDKQLGAIREQQAEVCAFCTGACKVGWGVAVFLSGGLAYLIKFFFDHHGVPPH